MYIELDFYFTGPKNHSADVEFNGYCE